MSVRSSTSAVCWVRVRDRGSIAAGGYTSCPDAVNEAYRIYARAAGRAAREGCRFCSLSVSACRSLESPDESHPRSRLSSSSSLLLALVLGPPRLARRPRPPPPPRAAGRGDRPRAGPGHRRGLPSVPHGRRPRRLGSGPRGAAARLRRRGRAAARDGVGGPARHPVPGLRAGREPRAVREAPLLPPREARRSRPGRASRGPGALHGRDRRRALAHLRGELLGRARPRRRPEAGVGPSRRHRAHRRPLRRGDGGAPRLDGLPDGRPSRRRSPARARARAPRGGPADPHPEPRARRLLVDGLHPARGEQLEPVDQLELAGERPPPRARPRAARARGGEDRAEPGPVHRRLPGRRRLRRGAELLGPGRGVALRVARAPARRDRRAPRRLPRAGRPRDRPVHRPRLHRGRLLRGHGRRVGEGEARAGARLPLRPGGGRCVPRGLRRLPRRPTRALRPATTSRATGASPASCRPSSGRAPSRPRRPSSRSPARSGSPTCR